MTDLEASADVEEHPPPYIIFILVFFFFGTGLLGFLVCHLLKKKGYRCRTVGEEEEEDDVEEKLALPDDDDDDEGEDNQDTVEQILKCIIENEANMEAFKEMLGNQNICEHHDPRLLRKESLGGIPPHHHTVHSGSGHNSCHLCAQGRSKKARRRSRATNTKTRPGEQTVFSVGRFRVTHTDKKPGLQGSDNLPTAESGEQLDQSDPLDSEKGEGSHRKEGYNLRNMFKDVKPESKNGVVPKRRKSLTLFNLRRGSDPQGVKSSLQPVVQKEGYLTRAPPPTVLEEADPTGPRQTSSPVSAPDPAPEKTPSPTPSQATTSTPSLAPTPTPVLVPVPASSPSATSAHSTTTPGQTSTPSPTSSKSPVPNPSPPSARSLPPATSPTPGTAPSPLSARSPSPAPPPAPTPAKSSAPTLSPPSALGLVPASSQASASTSTSAPVSPRLGLDTKVTSTRASPSLTRASPRQGSPVTPGVQMDQVIQGDLGSSLTSVSAGLASPRAGTEGTVETGRFDNVTPEQRSLWSPVPLVSSLPASPSSPLAGAVTIVKASPDSTREFSVVRMVELEGEGPSMVKEGLTVQGEGLVTQIGVDLSAGKKPAMTEELPKAQGEGPATMEEEPVAVKEEPRDEMVQMEDIRGCRVSQGEDA